MAAIAMSGVAQAKPRCKTKACHLRVEWKLYKKNPMPACTWVGESGGDYRARNPRSTAGGKYQFLDTTWWSLGGPDYPGTHDGAQAPPLLQERLARKLIRRSGIGQWVNC